ncbi:MAG TPA: hypothetical protein GXZ43_01260 [Clostridiaceae bacterium]|nr:hypothetical protein [Clostridiaceae bacterium]
MLKTTLAIFICITIDILRDSPNMVTSGISAILVMQINMDSSYSRGKLRILGIVISGIYSIIFYYLFVGVLNVESLSLLYVILFSLFTIPLMIIFNLLKLSDGIAIGLIYYMLTCLSSSGISDPLIYVADRFINMTIGLCVSLFINWCPPLNALGRHYEKFKNK